MERRRISTGRCKERKLSFQRIIWYILKALKGVKESVVYFMFDEKFMMNGKEKTL